MPPDAEPGLTFAQLRDRCLQDGYPRAQQTLAYVLRDEVRRGRIEYYSTSRRYELNGALDPAVVTALRQLT